VVNATNLKRGALRFFCARSERAYRTTYDHRTPEVLPADAPEIPVNVLVFAGRAHLPQLVASLRSFLEHVGRPRRIVVASDGSLGPEEATVLQRLDRSLEVRLLRPDDAGPFAPLAEFAREDAYGRKLAAMVVTNLDVDGPLLYFDSDVLFFPPAHDLWSVLGARSRPAFMEEPSRGAFDPRWQDRDGSLANSGFVYFPGPADWDAAVKRYAWLMESPDSKSEQTIVCLTLRDEGGEALDPGRFLLDYRDARSLRDVGASSQSAMARHYVAPIRWKFWVRVAGGWPRSLASVATGRWFGPVPGSR
jgi:hypothetical protein